jgi:hypothetical protein
LWFDVGCGAELALSFVKDYTFAPAVSHTIPDFASEHAKFEEKKKEVRKSFPKTETKPFQLTAPKVVCALCGWTCNDDFI